MLVKYDVRGELGVLYAVPAYQRFVEPELDEETEKFYARNVWPANRSSEDFIETAYANGLSHDRILLKIEIEKKCRLIR